MEFGKPRLICLGAPGMNYDIERAPQLGFPTIWEKVWTTNAPAEGSFLFIDDTPGLGTAFYRLRRL